MKLYGIFDAVNYFKSKGLKAKSVTLWYHYHNGNLKAWMIINKATPIFREKDLRDAIKKGVGTFKNKGPKKKSRGR